MTSSTNIFGEPITNETHLKDMECVDRAGLALQQMQSDNKHSNARTFGKHAKLGEDGVTCLIYNATGNPVHLIDCQEWFGTIGLSPYPLRLENGQWGVFFFKQDYDCSCKGAVVYHHGKDKYGSSRQWIFGWKQKIGVTRCYTTVHHGEYDYEYKKSQWTSLSDALDKGNTVSLYNDNMYTSSASIGNHPTAAICEGIMSLSSAW